MHRDQWRTLFESDGAYDLLVHPYDVDPKRLRSRITSVMAFLQRHGCDVLIDVGHIDARHAPLIEVVGDFLMDTGIINDAVVVGFSDDGIPLIDLTNADQDDLRAVNSALKWALRASRELKFQIRFNT